MLRQFWDTWSKLLICPQHHNLYAGYQIRFYQISWLCRGPFATPVGERPAVQCSLRPMMLAAAAALGDLFSSSLAADWLKSFFVLFVANEITEMYTCIRIQ